METVETLHKDYYGAPYVYTKDVYVEEVYEEEPAFASWLLSLAGGQGLALGACLLEGGSVVSNVLTMLPAMVVRAVSSVPQVLHLMYDLLFSTESYSIIQAISKQNLFHKTLCEFLLEHSKLPCRRRYSAAQLIIAEEACDPSGHVQFEKSR